MWLYHLGKFLWRKLMNLPPSDHIVWKIIRLAVVGTILTIMLAFTYNQFDNRDIITIIVALSGLAGFDTTKAFATRKPKETPPEPEETT
jgi:hypothetical protein